MRVLNPWTQRLLTAKPRRELPTTSFFCDYPQRTENGRARGDPATGPGTARCDPAPTGVEEKRGDPGG